MSLPPDLQLSQSSLQDYLDCPRRFELRYLLKVAWPALESEPVLEQERHMRQGQMFHQMVQQHLVGLPLETLQPPEDEADLSRWWLNYCAADPTAGLPARRLPEFMLSASLAGVRLVAKYDLLALEPGGRAVIMDWKTNRRRTPTAALQQRIQTRLYRWLLVTAGAQFNGGRPLQPEQVEMTYWFTDFPGDPAALSYDRSRFTEDETFLAGLITAIQATPPGSFILTPQEQSCQLCRYRSLCGRGSQAGSWESQDDDDTRPAFDGSTLDFDQIGEIAF